MVGIAMIAIGFLAWERLRPGRRLPHVEGWWLRVVLANLAQLAIVLAVGPLTATIVSPALPLDVISPFGAGTAAYLVSTFLWYWWHRARHELRPLWLGFHQFHHSPSRVEVAMAFYKHPVEQLANAMLSAAIAGPLFGLSPAGALVYATWAATAEFVYHANVRTPRWLGYFVQRPEMHRLHHATGHHAQNYADLPVWDMLFGTYANPREEVSRCGLADEARVDRMLLFHDASKPVRFRALALGGIAALGLASIAGTMLTPLAPQFGTAVATSGKLSLASPFPKVFCRVGETEPWTWEHTLTLTAPDGTTTVVPFDREVARRRVGPYMYRNAYGAAVVYGHLLPTGAVAEVLRHAACEDPDFRAVLGVAEFPMRAVLTSTSPQGETRRSEIVCRPPGMS